MGPHRPAAAFLGVVPASLSARCVLCGKVHTLNNDVDAATGAIAGLFDALAHEPALADERAMLGPGRGHRGKMFAAAVVEDQGGVRHHRWSYSGDLGGPTDRPLFAPSIIRREHTAALERETLATIAACDQRLAEAVAVGDEAGRLAAKRRRRAASAALMQAMIEGTILRTRGGLDVALPAAFAHEESGQGIPSGTADCAVPKLLHQANVEGVVVVGVAEAWWGPDHGERRHGTLQAPCVRRCQPILGALLCPDVTVTPT